MNVIKKAVLLAALLVATVGAHAQGMRMMVQGMVGPNMLGRKDVQADLKLTDDQKKKVTEMLTAMREERRQTFENMRSSGSFDPEAMQSAMKKMNADYTAKMNAILTADQQKRVKEIGLQIQKNGAIADPDVQNELNITAEQKSKIDDLMQKFQGAMMDLGQKMRSGEIDQEAARPLFKKNADTLNDELGKILTADQAAKLKMMGGAPFAADPNEGPQFRMGGRGGGGGGGG
jgi:Spy/CpxP family protein refolding chaperone